jgi:hypothetical protein
MLSRRLKILSTAFSAGHLLKSTVNEYDRNREEWINFKPSVLRSWT